MRRTIISSLVLLAVTSSAGAATPGASPLRKERTKYERLWVKAKVAPRVTAGRNLLRAGAHDQHGRARPATAHELARAIRRLRGRIEEASYGSWHTQGGSVYTGCPGAYGSLCAGRLGVAELGMGHAMGGLPGGTRLELRLAGRTWRVVTAYVLDIGAGGGPVDGYARAVDVHCRTLEALGVSDCSSWTGLVQWRRSR